MFSINALIKTIKISKKMIMASAIVSLLPLSAFAANDFAPGRILVSAKPGLSDAQLAKILEKHKGKSKSKISKINVHIVSVPEKAEKGIVNALSKNPNIDFVEVDELVASSEIHANDTKYSNAWHLSKMNLPSAWEQSKGEGIVVAVLDSGLYSNHPDLIGNVKSGFNVVSSNYDTSDINGHGTMVAGVISAVSDNNTGVTSIAWNTKVMPVRISNNSNGSAYTSDVAKGITWAADNGADIINISYGSIFKSSAVVNAAEYSYNKGGLVVTAAGNDGSDLNCVDNKYFIVVSATGSNDTKTSWSDYGNCVDVAAPGAGLPTTTKSGGYTNFSGTSAASPATAAVLALMKSKYPTLTNFELESLLESTADKTVSGTNYSKLYGHGRVDAASALSSDVEVPGSDQIAPSVAITSPAEDSTNSNNMVVQVNAQDNTAVSKVELYVSGTKVATDTTQPYSFSLDTTEMKNGEVSLEAYAYDAANNIGSTGNYWVQINNQIIEPEPEPEDTISPTVVISNPVNGQTISGNQAIQVSGKDNVGVKKIQLFIDSQLKSEVFSSSMSYSWNTKKAGTGNHSIKARVYDAAGNYSEQNIVVSVASNSKGNGKKPH
ncbi:S8 family serine peptidase [Thalassotalea nanhaiensis]|uniref:S8 family serine peptidase n=1 Tax=Thalassotalea nanhaiensis TaxID=3065648 RepID=A0ABY9TK34_9GAMM|nr:S8 family serine peptidase [Colwelliaceae bacterium SQ345]